MTEISQQASSCPNSPDALPSLDLKERAPIPSTDFPLRGWGNPPIVQAELFYLCGKEAIQVSFRPQGEGA